MAREGPLGHAPGREPARGGLLGDGARGVGDLGAPPVVHAHDEVEGRVVRRRAVGLLQGADHRLPQAGPAPAPPHVDAPLAQLPGAPLQHVAGVVHDERDLGGRALPVLRGERVDAEVAHPRVDGPGDGVHEGVLPRPVPLDAGQAAAVRPPAVAVHDQGDVRGDLALGEDGRGRLPLARPRQRRPGVRGRPVHGRGTGPGGRRGLAHARLLSRTWSERSLRSRCHWV